MSKLFLLGIACLGLVSCVFSKIEQGMKDLEGKPMSESIKALGYPSSQSRFGNDTIYTWGNSFDYTYSTPQIANTTGFVGGTPVWGQTTYNTSQTSRLSCKIRVISGANGLIKNADYNGNNGACSTYAKRLAKYSKSLKSSH